MNKYLLLWNVALTLLVLFVFIQGGSNAAKLTQLETQLASHQQTIETMNKAINDTSNTFTAQTQQIASLNAMLGNSITQTSLTLQKYVQDYVAAYFQAVGLAK